MAHEELNREHEVEGSSDRSFGLVFAALFAIIGLWPLLSAQPPRIWALIVAGAFAVLALVRPGVLAPLNKRWLAFGLLLGKIVSPIALGILFYGPFLFVGLLLRAFGKDPLRLRLQPHAKSYWIAREPPGPPPKSMENQF